MNFTVLYYRNHSVPVLVVRKLEVVTFSDAHQAYVVCVRIGSPDPHLDIPKENLNDELYCIVLQGPQRSCFSRQEVGGSDVLQCAPRVCVYVLVALTHILMFRKKNLNAVDLLNIHPIKEGGERSKR